MNNYFVRKAENATYKEIELIATGLDSKTAREMSDQLNNQTPEDADYYYCFGCALQRGTKMSEEMNWHTIELDFINEYQDQVIVVTCPKLKTTIAAIETGRCDCGQLIP